MRVVDEKSRSLTMLPYFPGGFPITGSNTSAGYISGGMAFVPTGTFRVTDVVVGVGWLSGSNVVTFSLDANNGGVPGAVLGSWTFDNLPKLGTTGHDCADYVFCLRDRSCSLVKHPGWWLGQSLPTRGLFGATTILVWMVS